MKPQILDASFIAAASEYSQLPSSPFGEIAFAGRSNVGKSSLINTLVQRRNLVRTSSTPGCTRGINIFRVRLQDASIDFVDLPGYGYAQRSKKERKLWGPLIEDYLVHRAQIRAVVVIVDVRRGVEDEENQLLDFLQSHRRPAILVATKLDKLPRSQQKLALNQVKNPGEGQTIGFSSVDAEGSELLWRNLLRAASIELKEPEKKR